MPLLCGDNPLSNELPSKFLRLTDYQLFLIRQWARGLFYNEIQEGWVKKEDVPVFRPYLNWTNRTGRDLDRGVLMNLMGGSFCPGAEVNWVIRNPAIYLEPFRLKADPAFSNFRQTAAQANANSRVLTVSESDYASYTEGNLSQGSNFETGLQPGDLTKYMSQPWQSDFNECTSQPIDITYEMWNVIRPESEHDPVMKRQDIVWETLWWPAHRPLQAWDPNVNALLFGYGTIVIEQAASELLVGTIGGGGWSLKLHGSRAYGSPAQVRFQGKGIVGGAEWIYDYIGWLVPVWPNSTKTLQRPAKVGSVTRTIPHPTGKDGKAIAPAGVVASFYAVRQD